jgi:hypothetical protein
MKCLGIWLYPLGSESTNCKTSLQHVVEKARIHWELKRHSNPRSQCSLQITYQNERVKG